MRERSWVVVGWGDGWVWEGEMWERVGMDGERMKRMMSESFEIMLRLHCESKYKTTQSQYSLYQECGDGWRVTQMCRERDKQVASASAEWDEQGGIEDRGREHDVERQEERTSEGKIWDRDRYIVNENGMIKMAKSSYLEPFLKLAEHIEAKTEEARYMSAMSHHHAI
eukprot:3932372-Rhodomonas_salina.1